MSELITVTPPNRKRVGRSILARPHQRARVTLIFAFIGAALLAAAVYQPWVNTPFDILDFSEFLPFLTSGDTFAHRFAEFATYYASQGRLNLLSYAFLIWKWSLFGWNEAAWQAARFVQMLLIIAGVYHLLRRLGTSRTGSAAAAALFIAAGPASPAWIRLTMGEPLGLLAILGASLVATWYQHTARWRTAGAVIATLLTASLLAKEMLVPFVPFVLLIACSLQAHGQFEKPCITQRNVWLVSLAALGVLAVLLPVAIVAISASPGAYASDYAVGKMSAARLVHSLTVVLLPVPARQASGMSLAPLSASIAYFGIVAVGLGLAHTNHGSRRHRQRLVVAAMLLAVSGVLIYLPWPHFQTFYALPFLLVPAILLGVAITAIEDARASWRWLAYLGCACILAQGALYAAHDARSGIAARVVNASLVSDFANHTSADSIVVVMRLRLLDAQSWQGRGATLGRYAKAVLPNQALPAIHEASCSAAQAMIDRGIGSAILVSYSTSCGTLPVPSRVVRYDYTYLEWPTLARQRDSLVISIVGPDARR